MAIRGGDQEAWVGKMMQVDKLSHQLDSRSFVDKCEQKWHGRTITVGATAAHGIHNLIARFKDFVTKIFTSHDQKIIQQTIRQEARGTVSSDLSRLLNEFSGALTSIRPKSDAATDKLLRQDVGANLGK